MRTAWDEPEAAETLSTSRGPKRRRWILAAAGLAILLVVAGVSLRRAWPFTRANVIHELELATSSSIQVKAFHRTFFPHPGCVAEGVRFSRGADPQSQSVLTVDRLIIQSSFLALFSKHVALIRAEGAHAVFAPAGSGPEWKPTASDVVVDELQANDALLEFTRHDPESPSVPFVVRTLVARHLTARDPMTYELRVKNPEPPGEVTARGSFGPWNMERLSATPISGIYSFWDADLGVFGGIGGTLSSDGKFQGTLENIAVEGKTKTPNFTVRGGTHQVPLSSEFRAVVNASNGDVALNQVWAQLGHTTIVSDGSVAGRENQRGKITALNIAVRSGRIQDLLLMFVSETNAPLKGIVSLKAKTMVPPGKKPFLQKLNLTGDFGIERALFTNEATQENLNKLSTAARGGGDDVDDPASVVSDLQGRVVIKDGVADFSELSFRVPGALAKLHGTFNLMSEKIDLHGVLLMEARLPKATSGIKSFLLKAIDPFLKKNKRGGAEFPVSITGTYQHPVYKADPV